MTPTRGLVDGQRTTIHGSGFPANTNVEVLECSGTLAAPPKDLSSCDGFTADTTGYSDEHGGYLNTPGDKAGGTSGYRIWVLPTSREAGMTIRCGAQDPCVLYVGVNFEDFKEPHTFVSMSFAPGAVSTLPGAPHSGLRATSAHHHSSVAPWAVAVAVMAIAGAAIVALVRRRRADGQPGDPRGRAAATFGEVAGKQP
jgi:hypothetical protein